LQLVDMQTREGYGMDSRHKDSEESGAESEPRQQQHAAARIH
jgi:hypothetical protein